MGNVYLVIEESGCGDEFFTSVSYVASTREKAVAFIESLPGVKLLNQVFWNHYKISLDIDGAQQLNEEAIATLMRDFDRMPACCRKPGEREQYEQNIQFGVPRWRKMKDGEKLRVNNMDDLYSSHVYSIEKWAVDENYDIILKEKRNWVMY